ncbi:MAG: hypothetical protein QW791_05835 [Candidatus Bathyarchaeia archaeon]
MRCIAGSEKSLLEVKAEGADVRIVYNAMDDKVLIKYKKSKT